MNEDFSFYTETMAGLYAKQGHHEKALAIYRYLSEKNPKREDLKEICAKLGILDAKDARIRLCRRIQEWMHLVFEHRKLILLKKIRYISS
jgi:hypothetical protein